MFENKWLRLQLFAEGAPAGDGGAASGGAGTAETGDTAAVAGQQQLEALGVPRHKITKRASAAVGREIGKRAEPKSDAGAKAGKPAQQAAAAAATEEGSKAEGLPQGITWEQIMADPAMNKRMQDTVKARLKDNGAAAAAMEAMRTMFEVLFRQYGIDPAKADYAALAKAVEGDSRYYEDMAIANGVDVDTARQMDAEDRAAKRQQEDLRQQQMRQRVASWRQQEAQLKAEGLNIDLNTEAQSPVFMAVLKATGNVRNAWESTHHAEIVAQREAAAAANAQQQTVTAIRAGNYRPGELGGSQAPSEMAPKTSYSDAEVQRIMEQVRKGARTGRRYAPGQI